mgnify:CR=1 FL=1
MGSFKPNNKSANRNYGGFHDDRPKRFSRPAPQSRGMDSDRFERRDSSPSFEKNMFAVTCAKCGVHCEVPFKPTNRKPVYCSDCFRKNDNYGPERERSAPSKSELGEINRKLDRIMKALDIE